MDNGTERGQSFLDQRAAQIHAKLDPAESAEIRANGATVVLPYPASEVAMLRGCDLKPEAIQWIWPGWLAAGKLHILGGAPSTGKTTIGMSLAATVTTRGNWPDGTYSPQGNVVIWSGEDDPADTLIPRLILSGADLSRVYFVGDVTDGNGKRSFDPARDMKPLADKLAEIGNVRLLIVDPIVSAIAGDSHKNAEVRRGLQPLVDLAGMMRCALVGITHFSKGTGGRDPVERITGSLAFGALARVVLVAARHQAEGEDGETKRVLLRAKSNIGPDDGGFEYDLQQGELSDHPGVVSSFVQWGTPVEGAARELLATADATGDDGDGGARGDAERFLSDLLADGPLPSKVVKADADGAGYAWATIRRAQKSLGIDAIKVGGESGRNGAQWMWRLPAENPRCSPNSQDAQQNNVSTLGDFEHLGYSTPLAPPAEADSVEVF
jgi:putative DNA primase/helicase